MKALEERGSSVRRLVRAREESVPEPDIAWDPESGIVPDPRRLENLDAVIHLAGENIADSRWTPEKKSRIRNSRVQGTALLAQGLAQCCNKPSVMISASAIGYYGDRGDERLTEASDRGEGFLANVCRDWESAAEPAREAGIRVVNLRIGMVLDRRGGVLAQMVPPFRWGAGGPVGKGMQYYSWIHLRDLVTIILFCLDHDEIRGPVNATAPNPVRCREFTASLAGTLHRPHVLPLPPFGLRLAFGEMADALMLAGARVEPEVLLNAGYTFDFPDVESALREELAEGGEDA